MSDQQMQFADPEWQPPQQRRQSREESAIPRPINNPSTEQAGRQAPPSQFSSRDDDYARGYQARQTQQQNSQSTFQPPHARTSPWFWIIIVLLLFVVFGGGPFVVETGFALFRVVLIGLVFLGIIAAVLVFLFRSNSYTNTSTSGHFFMWFASERRLPRIPQARRLACGLGR